MLDGLNLAWSWSPIALAGLLVLCVGYGLGVRSGRRRSPEEARLGPWRIIAFVSALVLLGLVFFSPLEVIGRTQLFLAHMAQVLILTTICAPLLLGATPAWLLQPILKVSGLRNVLGWLTRPIQASLIFNACFLLWHSPLFFTQAMRSPTTYQLLLLSIFLAALLNWWPLIGSLPELRRMTYPMQMLYAFLDGQPVDIFAFLLVFAGVPFYLRYQIPPQLGLTPMADQMAGGALLMLPGLVDLLVMSPLFFRWLGTLEEKAQLHDERNQARAEAELAALAASPVEGIQS